MEQFVYTKEGFQKDNNICLLEESIFHSANGYLGVRASFEEGYPEGFQSIRGQYINAFYEIVDMPQAEKLNGLIEQKQTILNIADTQTINVYLNGEKFSMFEGTVENYRRSLDMQTGIVTRALTWVSPKGYRSDIIIRRMTSFVRPSLFLIDYQVTPQNYDGDIVFESSHMIEAMNYADPNDPRIAGESQQYLFAKDFKEEEQVTYGNAITKRSGLEVCSAVYHQLDQGTLDGCDRKITENNATTLLTVKGCNNEAVRLVKYSVFGDTVHHGNAEEHVRNQIASIRNVSLDDLYKEQEEYLQKFWNNSLLFIEGDKELNIAVRYNQYQLLQSVGKDDASNIAAKGLSGEGYEGHFFWDTEMYIQPFFLLTNPDIVKKLIRYRYKILPQALENARALGHTKGALYPWRTINGEECSGYFPSGTAQYHISGDIAYSVIQYYLVTRDSEFMQEAGAEIVMETARLWADTTVYSDGSYHIHEVTGPDEYTCLVSDNYYTNALAKYNLEWAERLSKYLPEGKRISDDEAKQFKVISELMYLPYNKELGINPQDSSFLSKKVWDFDGTPKEKYPLLLHYHPLCLYRHQVCKQADTVLSHFILEDYQEKEVIEKSFAYYEDVTTHDSSLSTCIFSIVASRLGQQEKAIHYFGESAKLDLFNTHGNTKDGIHTANMGGTYMSVIYGFAGLRVKEDGFHLSPFLPEGWESYTFRLVYRGSCMEFKVVKDGCHYKLISGEPCTVVLYGNAYTIDEKMQFVIQH